MNPIPNLINLAEQLSNGLGELVDKSESLLADGKHLEEKMLNVSKASGNEETLKRLIKEFNDDNFNDLLENFELKKTLEEYNEAIEIIFAKYKQHSNIDEIREQEGASHDEVRVELEAAMQRTLTALHNRMDLLLLTMQANLKYGDDFKEEIPVIIHQLKSENEMMRRQLQLSEDPAVQDPPKQESQSTQVDPEQLFAAAYGSECSVSSDSDESVICLSADK